MDIIESQQLAGEHYKTGNLHSAADMYEAILRLQPHDLTALFMLGLINAQTGNYAAAIDHLQHLIKMHPSHADAHYNLGNVYRDKGEIHEAFKHYQRTLQINPNYTEVYVNLGVIYRLLKRYEEEQAFYQKALQINPASAEAFFNLGHTFFEREAFDKALACYQKVVELSPNNVHAYMNLGLSLTIAKRFEEAVSCYRKALSLDPRNAFAHWHLSNVLLLLGNYTDGWQEFEWFREIGDDIQSRRTFSQPLWDGFDIRGFTILLHAEKGFGDTIQFIRYVPLVAQRGAKVIVECQKELTSLLRNIEGFQQVLSFGEKLPAFDVHCPLMSLPRIFNTTLENIPSLIPYLTADNTLRVKWHKRLQNDLTYLKIGLIWSGGGLPLKKSTSLDMFSPLAQLTGITFYSLQKGPPAGQAMNPPPGLSLVDFTNEIHDFSDTAALIQNLDLVISVDTAVAHLAGALGKPAWVLLPFLPDWRWLLNRDDSPWYPTMRLFRQPALGDWDSAITSIVNSLKQSLVDKQGTIGTFRN
jgi:Flp pilus assembly protein TadD